MQAFAGCKLEYLSRNKMCIALKLLPADEAERGSAGAVV